MRKEHTQASFHARPIPDCLIGVYHSRRPWETYLGFYFKKPCDILLKDGSLVGPCWFNAGKVSRIETPYEEWGAEEVEKVAYYRADGEDPMPALLVKEEAPRDIWMRRIRGPRFILVMVNAALLLLICFALADGKHPLAVSGIFGMVFFDLLWLLLYHCPMDPGAGD